MQKYIQYVVMALLMSMNVSYSADSECSSNINVDEWYARYGVDISSETSDYDVLCQKIKKKPLPYWRVLVNRVGSSLLVSCIACKEYIAKKYNAYKQWVYRIIVIQHKKIVKESNKCNA